MFLINLTSHFKLLYFNLYKICTITFSKKKIPVSQLVQIFSSTCNAGIPISFYRVRFNSIFNDSIKLNLLHLFYLLHVRTMLGFILNEKTFFSVQCSYNLKPSKFQSFFLYFTLVCFFISILFCLAVKKNLASG